MKLESSSNVFSNDLTDTGNANRFVNSTGGELLFDTSAKQWLSWEGARWSTQNALSVATKLAQSNSLELERIRDAADADTHRNRLNWAKTSRSASRINATLTLASKDNSLRVNASDFDSRLDALYVPNGEVDLRRATLTGPAPAQRNLRLANTHWKPDVEAPRFLQFVDEVCCGDEELAEYLQVMLGYAATGYTSEQSMFILWGEGANGKSTLFNILAATLGDYCTSFDFSHLLHSDKANVRSLEMLAALDGKRLAYASEISHGQRLNEALIKKITGGDSIYASRLHQPGYHFTPRFTPFLLTNHLPRIQDLGYGMRRRLTVVPFNASFGAQTQDLSIEEAIVETERPGVLRWVVEGARKWLSSEKTRGSRLPYSKAVAEATSRYFASQDVLMRFLKETGKLSLGYKVKASALFNDYIEFLESIHHHEHVTAKSLSSRMGSYGFHRRKESEGMTYEFRGLPEMPLSEEVTVEV